MAENGEKKPAASAWASPPMIVSIASILISVGALLQMVYSLERRVTDSEQRERASSAVMAEMNANIKLLLERTDPRRQQ